MLVVHDAGKKTPRLLFKVSIYLLFIPCEMTKVNKVNHGWENTLDDLFTAS